VKRYWLLNEPTLSNDEEEGRDIYLQPLLDEASDNSVAEIMDSKILLFIYLWVNRKTERNGTYYRRLVYTAYTFKRIQL
jgi:acetyl-CoA synthetase